MYVQERLFGEVSIPQSGFGAFERRRKEPPRPAAAAFQSLSRDSGRLNDREEDAKGHDGHGFQSLSRDSGRLNTPITRGGAGMLRGFNPSVGIRGV